jgi:hypothetical protein
MADGKQRTARAMLVAQAALVWDLDGKLDTETFVDTGSFGKGAAQVMPFNEDLRAAIVAEFEGKT